MHFFPGISWFLIPEIGMIIYHIICMGCEPPTGSRRFKTRHVEIDHCFVWTKRDVTQVWWSWWISLISTLKSEIRAYARDFGIPSCKHVDATRKWCLDDWHRYDWPAVGSSMWVDWPPLSIPVNPYFYRHKEVAAPVLLCLYHRNWSWSLLSSII